MVQVSNKCTKLCVSNIEAYQEQGIENIKGCEVVGWDKIIETNTTLNDTSGALNKIFCVGTDGS